MAQTASDHDLLFGTETIRFCVPTSSCLPHSQTPVSNVRQQQQYLVKETFRLLMARPTSRFRELIKAVWWRSCSCTMSLTDPKISKIRNAQLGAFMGAINMY